jgi:hypothetical protein
MYRLFYLGKRHISVNVQRYFKIVCERIDSKGSIVANVNRLGDWSYIYKEHKTDLMMRRLTIEFVVKK